MAKAREPGQQGTEQASMAPLSAVAPRVQTAQRGDPGHVLSPALQPWALHSSLSQPVCAAGALAW